MKKLALTIFIFLFVNCWGLTQSNNNEESHLKNIVEKINNNQVMYFNQSIEEWEKSNYSPILYYSEEFRLKVFKNLNKKYKSFLSDISKNFIVLDGIETFSQNTIEGFIFGEGFMYTYTVFIEEKYFKYCNRVTLEHVVFQDKYLKDKVINKYIISKLKEWDISFLKKMDNRPISTWNKKYLNFIDSLDHEKINPKIIDGAYYFATRVQTSGFDILKLETISFYEF